MADIHQFLREDSTRHQHYYQRLTNAEVEKVLRVLNDMSKAARDILLEADGELTAERIRRITDRIQQLKYEYSGQLDLVDGFTKIAERENDLLLNSIKTYLPIRVDLEAITATRLQAAIRGSEIAFGGDAIEPLQNMLNSIADEFLDGIESGIRSGYAIGKTRQQIVKDVFGQLPAKWSGVEAGQAKGVQRSLLAKGRRRADSIVRTAMSHIQSEAHKIIYEENNELVKGYEWNAALDKKTCPVCANLDGKVWLYQGGGTMPNQVMPPIHPRCRCTTVPVLKTYKELGIAAADRPRGGRVSMNGYENDYVTYAQWFEKQDDGFKREFLGKTRFDLYQKGKFKVSQYADLKDNSIITLEELK